MAQKYGVIDPQYSSWNTFLSFHLCIPNRGSLKRLQWVRAELLRRTVEVVGDWSIISPCHLKILACICGDVVAEGQIRDILLVR